MRDKIWLAAMYGLGVVVQYWQNQMASRWLDASDRVSGRSLPRTGKQTVENRRLETCIQSRGFLLSSVRVAATMKLAILFGVDCGA